MTYVIFLSISAIGALYSYSWDLYMDWGLLRSNKPGRRGLRDTLLYPTWCYYTAAVTDLLLRFAWVLSLWPAYVINEFWGSYFQVFLADILEWFRRSMWAAFRVENENINNFERYRAVPDMPKLDLEAEASLRRQITNRRVESSEEWPKLKINSILSHEEF